MSEAPTLTFTFTYTHPSTCASRFVIHTAYKIFNVVSSSRSSSSKRNLTVTNSTEIALNSLKCRCGMMHTFKFISTFTHSHKHCILYMCVCARASQYRAPSVNGWCVKVLDDNGHRHPTTTQLAQIIIAIVIFIYAFKSHYENIYCHVMI